MGKFKEHVFISYAHQDNPPRYHDPDGWVTRFNKELEKVLTMRLGRKARIWRDDKRMAGNSVLDEEIKDGLKNSALLVTVLSPCYLNSPYCRDELDLFCNYAESSIGLRLKNGRKIRIFKVVKLPVPDRNSLPPPLPDSLEFSFYSEDIDMELDPGINMSDIPDYNKKIVGIAKHASDAIQELEQQCDSHSDVSNTRSECFVPGLATSVKIFLAECSSDMRDLRENLRTDLIAFNGYTVLPEQSLPVESEDDHRERVSSLLRDCDLSIHIIGDGYGTIPEGPSEKSIVVLQNEIAAEASRSTGLKRLIWLPRTAQPKKPRQQAFIEQLQREPSLQKGDDLLAGDFEEFRTAVHQWLKAQAQEKKQAALAAEPSSGQEDSERYVYMICTREDLAGTRRLRKTLKERGYRVKMPPLEGTETPEEWKKQHLEHLRGCAGLLLFYGAGGDKWYKANRSDLLKINAYRDGVAGGPIPRYTYVAEPDNDFKEDLVDMGEESCLIDGRRGFDPILLDPFLDAMARERSPV